MTHRADDQPGLRERIIAAWGGRATIRRNLAIAVGDALLLTLALEEALRLAGVDLGLGFTSAVSTTTRILYGLGLWFASLAWRQFTGEAPRGDDSAPQ